MHITLETDYAIRLIDYLAKNKKRFDAKTISENTDVPLRFSLKILRNLAANDMVKSFKGAKGGYELAVPTNELSLYDIVEAVEGTYMFSRCLDKHYNCTRSEKELPCTYQRAFAHISNVVCEELKKLTFDQFVD